MRMGKSRMGESGDRPILCPACGAFLDWLAVVNYNTPFRCVNCPTELRVPTHYLVLVFSIGFATAVGLCLAMGLQGMALMGGMLIALLPSLFGAGVLLRRVSPLKLVVYRVADSLPEGPRLITIPSADEAV
jgi:hypothetical protein